jgi:hypothetical protein
MAKGSPEKKVMFFLFLQAWNIYFENFSDDFAVWVIFYGPEGGEESNYRGLLMNLFLYPTICVQ